MSVRARLLVFGAGAIAVGVLLIWSFTGLPAFGHYRGPYGDIVNGGVVAQRRVSEAVGAVTFDYRGIDTLGEELILLSCVVGVVVLLREEEGKEIVTARPREDEGRGGAGSEAVRFWGRVLVGPTLVLGAAIVGHGHLTPGGGFQGGAVLASAMMIVYIAGTDRALGDATPPAILEPLEALGAAGYVTIGLIGLVVGSAFLENVIPLGTSGTIPSGGMLPILNTTVGLEVSTGMLLIVHQYLRQLTRVHGGGER